MMANDRELALMQATGSTIREQSSAILKAVGTALRQQLAERDKALELKIDGQRSDVAPLADAVDKLVKAIAGVALPATDLAPVTTALGRLADSLPAPTPPVDLLPLVEAVDRLTEGIPAQADPLDLTLVVQALALIANGLPTLDLKSVVKGLDAVVKGMPRMDLSPMVEALHGISESQMAIALSLDTLAKAATRDRPRRSVKIVHDDGTESFVMEE